MTKAQETLGAFHSRKLTNRKATEDDPKLRCLQQARGRAEKSGRKPITLPRVSIQEKDSDA